jgi:MFS transporter
MLKLWRDRSFVLILLGNVMSVMGDHVGLIAFSWLVLMLTGSAMQMGIVLALQGLPRAILMLYGGALVDRFSPQRLMIWSNLARFVIISYLAFVISTGTVSLATVYCVAVVFGIVDAFFYPASGAILPSIVKRSELKEANSLVQTTAQAAIFLSPALAGLIIAATPEFGRTLPGDSVLENGQGLSYAFWFGAVTFVVSAALLFFARSRTLHDKDKVHQDSYNAIKDAIVFVWNAPALRLFFITIAGVIVFFNAPFLIGIPILAEQRFEDGAAAFGYIVAAFGGGALVSGLTAGFLPMPTDKAIGPFMFGLIALLGVVWGSLAFVPTLPIAVAIMFVGGLGDGLVIVYFTTWLQRATPDALLGRVMSIQSFVFIGLLPIADSVMGVLLEWNLVLVMASSGIAIVLIASLTALHPDARKPPRQVHDVSTEV